MKKILYDISDFVPVAGRETGIGRVAVQLLGALAKRADCFVCPLITLKDIKAEDYLINKGYDNLLPRIVCLPNLHQCNCLSNGEKGEEYESLSVEYTPIINSFDEYVSVWAPISDLVYQCDIVTKYVVHDMMPVYVPEYFEDAVAQRMKRWLDICRADEIIAVSEYTKQAFLSYRTDYQQEQVRIAYLGADASFSPDSRSQNIYSKYEIPHQRYAIAVSEISERKNFIHMLKSFACFLDMSKANDICLVVVGVNRRGYQGFLNSVASLKQYQDKIIITGYVPNDDLPALVANAEMAIYPSLYEGFGLPVLEAMQSGTPVICTDNTSIPEVGGDAVRYISGYDVKETSQAILDLYSCSKLRRELSTKGILRASQFSWEQCARKAF